MFKTLIGIHAYTIKESLGMMFHQTEKTNKDKRIICFKRKEVKEKEVEKNNQLEVLGLRSTSET